MDNFSEYMVKRKRKSYEGLLHIAVAVGLIVLAFACLAIPLVGPAFFAVLVIFGYLYLKYSSVEYEYTQTNVHLDIDRINGKSRRRRMLSVKVTDFVEFGQLSGLSQSAAENKKRVDYSSGSEDDSKKYYFILNDDHTVYYVFEPSEKMLNNMKVYYRGQIV